MLAAGLRDSEAGVTERYGPDAARLKAWELFMSTPGTSISRGASPFLTESSGQPTATVIIAIKPQVGIMLK